MSVRYPGSPLPTIALEVFENWLVETRTESTAKSEKLAKVYEEATYGTALPNGERGPPSGQAEQREALTNWGEARKTKATLHKNLFLWDKAFHIPPNRYPSFNNLKFN